MQATVYSQGQRSRLGHIKLINIMHYSQITDRYVICTLAGGATYHVLSG